MAPFLAAVAVFAASVGGFLTGLMAFLIFGLTMGLLVFTLAYLGASSGQALARPLRRWSRLIQRVSAAIIIAIGAGLIYASLNPGVLMRWLLPG